jgi:hypothetical protein
VKLSSVFMMFKRATQRGLLLGSLLAFSASVVMAALGQAPAVPASGAATALAPAAKVLAAKPLVSTNLYTVHAVHYENGTLVQEYANAGGVVFAVSWRGPVMPILSEWLGAYFDSFKQDVAQARLNGKRGAPVNIERADLVVRSMGRTRNFFGHAYAPGLLPAGVSIQDVLQ